MDTILLFTVLTKSQNTTLYTRVHRADILFHRKETVAKHVNTPATIDEFHRFDSEHRGNDVIRVVTPSLRLDKTINTAAHEQ